MVTYLEELTSTPENGFSALDTNSQQELLTLQATCKQHWEKFIKDPHFLYDELETLKSNKA